MRLDTAHSQTRRQTAQRWVRAEAIDQEPTGHTAPRCPQQGIGDALPSRIVSKDVEEHMDVSCRIVNVANQAINGTFIVVKEIRAIAIQDRQRTQRLRKRGCRLQPFVKVRVRRFRPVSLHGRGRWQTDRTRRIAFIMYAIHSAHCYVILRWA